MLTITEDLSKDINSVMERYPLETMYIISGMGVDTFMSNVTSWLFSSISLVAASGDEDEWLVADQDEVNLSSESITSLVSPYILERYENENVDNGHGATCIEEVIWEVRNILFNTLRKYPYVYQGTITWIGGVWVFTVDGVDQTCLF